MNKLSFFGNTDVGCKRTNNEDAFIAQYIWNDNYVIAAAIDGVGGYEGGEVASAMAQKDIVEYLELYPNGEPADLLKQAVIHANNTIYAARKNSEMYNNMSCVLTAVLIDVANYQIHMAHVGDTRLYQYVDGLIVKLSHDHSLIGYREEIGDLTEEEAMKHPQRNVIGRDVGSTYLGNGGKEYVEVATFPLLPNSILLLCSDGLCDMITSAQMRDVLSTEAEVKDKVAHLIQAANDAGGKDNVTVVLIEYLEPDAVSSPVIIEDLPIGEAPRIVEVENIAPSSNNRKRGFSRLKLILLLLIALVLGFAIGAYMGKIFLVEQPQQVEKVIVSQPAFNKNGEQTNTVKENHVEGVPTPVKSTARPDSLAPDITNVDSAE